MILDSLQSRKYCEDIVDFLLLFIPGKRSLRNKSEDLLKVFLKMGWKFCQSEHYMGNTVFIKGKKDMCKTHENRGYSKIKTPYYTQGM